MENNLNLTPELLEKAKSAPSATALLTLAQENGITLTAEQAATYYARFHPETGAISDEEMDNVSGGGFFRPQPAKCRFCGHTEFDHINAKTSSLGYVSNWTWLCKNCRKYDRI